jgi:tape measure domain-containing protein
MATDNVRIVFDDNLSELTSATIQYRNELVKNKKAQDDLYKAGKLGAKEYIDALSKIDDETNKLDRDTKKLSKDMSDGMTNSGKGATMLSSTMGSLKGMIAGAFAVSKVLEMGKEILNLGIEAQKTAIQFKVLTGNISVGNALLAQLRDFAAKTPFEELEINNSAKSLLAYNFAVKDVIPTLKSLGDVSSGLNIPLNELVELYGKAKVQGRLYLDDVNQLTGRGIPVIQEFAKQFDVADSEVNKLVESGKIGFPELEKAIQSMTTEGGKFVGMTTELSESTGGKLTTLGDNIKAIGRDIGTFFLPAVNGAIDGVNNLLTAINNSKVTQSIFDGFRFGFDKSKMSINQGLDKLKTDIDSFATSKELEDAKKKLDEFAQFGSVQKNEFLRNKQIKLSEELSKKIVEIKNYEALEKNKIDAKAFADKTAKDKAESDSAKKEADKRYKEYLKHIDDKWKAEDDAIKKREQALKKENELAKSQNEILFQISKNTLSEIEKANQLEVNLVKQKYLDNILSADEYYAELKRLELENLTNISSNANIEISERKKANQKILDNEVKAKSEFDKFFEDLVKEQDTAQSQEDTKKKKKRAKTKEEKEAEDRAYTDFAIESAEYTANQLLAIQDRKNQAELDKQMEQSEKLASNAQTALQNQLSEGVITQETFNKISEQIEVARLAREAKIKQDAWIKERNLQLIQIGINTAVGVSKVIAQTGILSPAAIIPIIGLGALQAAFVLAQPVPKFAKGGYTGKGMGMIDETGHRQAGIVHDEEYVVPKEMVVSQKPLIDHLENIRTGKSTKKLVGDYNNFMVNDNTQVVKAIQRNKVVSLDDKTIKKLTQNARRTHLK